MIFSQVLCFEYGLLIDLNPANGALFYNIYVYVLVIAE